MYYKLIRCKSACAILAKKQKTKKQKLRSIFSTEKSLIIRIFLVPISTVNADLYYVVYYIQRTRKYPPTQSRDILRLFLVICVLKYFCDKKITTNEYEKLDIIKTNTDRLTAHRNTLYNLILL